MTRTKTTDRTRRGSHGTHRAPTAPIPAPGQQRPGDLSERERQFVEHFMASGNATKAAAQAGYSKNTASQIGYRLLRKVQVQQAIAERTERDPAVWTREDRQRFWTEVARGQGRYAKAALKDRLRASELLGKSQADFVDRHELTSGGGPIQFQVITNVPQPEGLR